MKTAWRMGGQALMYFVVLVMLSFMFVMQTVAAPMWIHVGLSLLMLGCYGLMLYGDGAARGERAATLSASIERQKEEGRIIDPDQLPMAFALKSAWIGYGIGVAPLIVVGALNLIFAPGYLPEQFNPMDLITRVVLMPYQMLYSLLETQMDLRNWLLLVCPLIAPLCMPLGYMQGPRLRKKKLEMIAKGVKRKRKALKVNKPRQRKPPKMEI